jgi:hypothetical protein
MLHRYLQAETWSLDRLAKVEGLFREKIRQESCWRVAFAGVFSAPVILFSALPLFLAGTLNYDDAADYCFDLSLPEGSEIRQRYDDKDSSAGAAVELFPTLFFNLAAIGFSLVCFWAWLFKSPQRAATNPEAVLLDVTCTHVLCSAVFAYPLFLTFTMLVCVVFFLFRRELFCAAIRRMPDDGGDVPSWV